MSRGRLLAAAILLVIIPAPASIALAADEPSPSPLVWTPASIEQDWPAPVREEPVGDPVIIQVADGYLDPQGDIDSPDMPWIDILRVRTGRRGAQVDLGGALPSEFVVPSEPWVAYGLVFDTDLDGVADVRLGMDLVPVVLGVGSARESGDTAVRVWRTDLRTGTTEVGEAVDDVCECTYPGTLAETGQPMAKFYPVNDGTPYGYGEIPGHFYAWASVIQDGRVVATDYAPDVGWLDPGAQGQPNEPGESPPA